MPPIVPSASASGSDTIVALSTPAGRSATGVMRLSGPDAERLARLLVPGRRPPPRVATLGTLRDQDGSAVDQVLTTRFPGPASYTGEDVVEISCHGSPPVLRFALERALSLGGRIAEPGEFTRRAFCNGRIDLVQAEGVRDLIDATTLYQARVATRQTAGSLSKRLRGVKRSLLDLVAMLEAGIDFAEDDVEVAPADEILARLDDMLDRVRRAIVNPVAGTTRDSISETASFDGIPAELVDTAGIRGTTDEVESEGVRRSWQSLQDADCALVVVDLSQPPTAEDRELWRRVDELCPALLVGNKIDLPTNEGFPQPLARVSAKTGDGIGELRATIRERALPGLEALHEETFVTNVRQEGLLRASLEALERAYEAAQGEIPHEMLLLDLYEALEGLDGITGATTMDDILDRIFSTFCIGK